MEQKDYKLEVVEALLKGGCHVRALARLLGTNHMMIVRKIAGLYRNNVVDFRREGKNKMFFLKRTIEAKNHVYAAEQYELLRLLERYPGLRRIVQAVQDNQKIRLAVIFGSYAKHNAREDSDIDLYVETTSKKLKSDLELLDSRLNVKIGKYNKSSDLIREIERHHIIVKGVETFYEKSKFFEQAA